MPIGPLIKIHRSLAMRMAFLLISVNLVQISANAYSQGARLTIELRDMPVEQVLNEIMQVSEFNFIYRSDLFDGTPNISLNVKESSIEEILNEFIVPLGYGYELDDKTVIFRKRRTPPPAAGKVSRQPTREVTGTVKDASGAPVTGANVVVKGTTIGTSTDLEGRFVLQVPLEAKTLIISFVGMLTQEIEIMDNVTFYVVMDQGDVAIDEVIVVGYGTQKKSDITGAVSSVDKTRIEEMVSTDVTQMIQGAVAGLTAMSTSAGAEQTDDNSLILIRGRNSITASNKPLFVLDGIPYEGDIGDLNPGDILSIEVLKDASSAAIYGSRGANGVILITTRKGAVGRTKIVYDGYYSIQQVANFPDVMNGEEYYEYKKNWVEEGTDPGDDDAALSDSEREVYESGDWTDWREVLLRTGESHRHNLSLSGGTKSINWLASTSYLKIKGIALNDEYSRLTSRLNLSADITDWLTVGTSTQLTFSDKSGDSPSFSAVFRMSPLVRAYNEDGTVNITPLPDNPLKKSPLEDILYADVNKTYQALSNNYLEINFPWVKGLSYRLNAGVRFTSFEKAYYAGMNTVQGQLVNSEGSITRGPGISYTLENIATYRRKFGKHSLFLTGLYGYEGKKTDISTTYAKGFPNDLMKWYGIPQASLVESTFDYEEEYLISQMLRVNYGYDSRYLLTLTARRDGFSGFGRNTKWGIFPSIALGWNLADEDFFPFREVMNVLKLRFSYGENGNQAVTPYQTIDRLAIFNYVNGSATAPGYIPSDMGTPDLGWESTRSMNIGFDYAFLKSRINGDFNIYNNDTYDLLLERSISPVHGDDRIYQNVGKTNNRGIELTVNSTNIRKTYFSWSSSANISLAKNKIVELQYGDQLDDLSSRLFIGEAITSNYDYRIAGVWQLGEEEQALRHGGALPGYARYEDVMRDSLLTPDDRTIIGHTDPNISWGITNTFRYKNIWLSVFIYGMHGLTKPNPLKHANVFIIRNWWTPDNPTNDMWDKDDRMANAYWVDGGVDIYERAGFVRIKDISLNYNLPPKVTRFLGMEEMTVYVSGKNLFTATNYEGMDPELDTQRAVPLQKEYLFGVKVTF